MFALRHQIWIESGVSAQEFYNLNTDPHELTSRHATMNADVKEQWMSRLKVLSTCQAASCR
jgi:hypothetical protein